MAEVKWIKITTDMFDDEKIKIIQSLPEGDSILVIWVRLIILAGKTNANGYVYINENLPYTEETLSIIFNKPISIIKLALQTFSSLKMIENDIDGIYLINFEKYQNIDGLDRIREQNRLRKQKQREKQKMLNSHVTSRDSHATDKEEDKDIDKEIDDVQIIKCYEENIGIITPASAELLLSYTDTFNQEIICEAIKKSAIANKRSCKYIVGILKDWKNKGLKTLLDIETEQENFKNKKGNRAETDEEKMARKLKALEGDSSD